MIFTPTPMPTNSRPYNRRMDRSESGVFRAEPVNKPRPPKARVKESEKPFMVWDGEGDESVKDTTQNYILFGYLNGAGDTDYIQGKSLSTLQCLEFLYSVCTDFSDHIHVSFGFGYDVDQITKDIPDETLSLLNQEQVVNWNGWKITYFPHKFIKLKKHGKGHKEITVFDAMTFFATSLVKAAKQYVPGHPLLNQVASGKDKRGTFTYAQLYSVVIPYWRVENELLLHTMSALRNSLTGAGIILESWHGPGAVANTLIKSNRLGTHIKTSRDEMPQEVKDATQFAFFGGRFENTIIGRIPGPIYGYDLRSAYPAALAELPGLSHGTWKHIYDPNVAALNPWGLYRYIFPITQEPQTSDILGLGPLPNRAPNGTVSFALCGEGWSYGHELIAAHIAGWEINVPEGWEYVTDDPTYPFIFTKEMYVKRAQYKKAGNPAQLGLKLGMNSVYGKLAQTVGFDEETLSPPRYHQSWYAGQITSWCRARIALAMGQNVASVIACETDGIYSLEPLRLRIGPHLGEWEETRYDEMIYVQSGFYFARKGECPNGCSHRPQDEGSECAWQTSKVRGLSTGKHADLSVIFDSVDTLAPITTYVPRYGSLTGYVGRAQHHQWFDQKRETVWGGGGKRAHYEATCPRCQGESEAFHRTVMTRPVCSASQPRTLPWTDDPELEPIPGQSF